MVQKHSFLYHSLQVPGIYLLCKHYTIMLAIFWSEKLGTQKRLEIHNMTSSYVCSFLYVFLKLL